jgi:hypothetical protein
MIVDTPETQKRQQGSIHLKAPTIGKLDPRVESDRCSAPCLSFGDP